MAQRNQYAHFLNVGTAQSPNYARIGKGVTEASLAKNPKTFERPAYIHETSGASYTEGYAGTMPVTIEVDNTDPVYLFVDDIRFHDKTAPNSFTDIVHVDMWKTPQGGEYPAKRYQCDIQVDTEGAGKEEGGQSLLVIEFTVNHMGDAVFGTFNPTTKTFTETVSS